MTIIDISNRAQHWRQYGISGTRSNNRKLMATKHLFVEELTAVGGMLLEEQLFKLVCRAQQECRRFPIAGHQLSHSQHFGRVELVGQRRCPHRRWVRQDAVRWRHRRNRSRLGTQIRRASWKFIAIISQCYQSFFSFLSFLSFIFLIWFAAAVKLISINIHHQKNISGLYYYPKCP